MLGLRTWLKSHYSTYSIVALYLLAITVANLTVALFGPAWSVLNAFLFIGFTLTTRDKLHEVWNGAHLKRNMLLLILAGSIISFALGSGRIAIASFLAFSLSELVDTISYHALRDQPKHTQVNGSNFLSALVDSLLFPIIAFGWPPLIPIILGQFLAKFLGGAIWSIILFNPNKTLSKVGK